MKTMKIILPFILVIGTALISCTNTGVNEGKNGYEGHPIIGVWSMNFDGCIETHEFLPDGTRTCASNLERVKSAYDISRSPLTSGYYKIKVYNVKDNGKTDCTGSTYDATGKVVESYIIFGDNSKYFALCKEESLKRCLGPFQKIEMAEPAASVDR